MNVCNAGDVLNARILLKPHTLNVSNVSNLGNVDNVGNVGNVRIVGDVWNEFIIPTFQ